MKQIDCNNGRILWSVNLPSFTKSKLYNFSSLFVGSVSNCNDKIFIVSEYADIYSICINTGSVIWQTKLVNEILSLPPVIINGIVLIYSDSGMLRGLNECDGSIKWILNFDVPLFVLKNKSIVANSYYGILLFDDGFGMINAISIDNGKLLWKKRIIELNLNSNGVISRFDGIKIFTINKDNLVCVQNYGSINVAILDVCSGSIINWLYGIGSVKYIISNNNNLYIVDQSNQLTAIDISTGKILWKQNGLLNKNLTCPGFFQGCIVLGDNKGYLYLIDVENGALVYKKKIISFGILNVPVTIGNKLFVQSVNGVIYSFCIFI